MSRLLKSNQRRATVMIQRMGSTVEVRRRGGGKLVVPAGSTYVVEAGETVRFEEVEINGSIEENGTLITGTEGELENKYGHLQDREAGKIYVGEVPARKMYPLRDQLPDQERLRGGAQPTENPTIVFPERADVQEDDEIAFPDGTVYRLQSELERQTHKQFEAAVITS